jgi:soluble lytic murein transglycosylase
MSTRTHSTQATRGRSRGRGRPRARGRRTFVALLLIVGIGAMLAAAVLPTLKDAAREFTLPLHHADIIRQQAREKDLPADLIAGVIYAESKFSDQTSHAGARGLMQVTPATAHAIATRTGGSAFQESDLSDPEVNIRYGTWYLRNLMDHYGGDVVYTLAAYNAGQGNVDRWVADAKAGGGRLRVSSIPFAETRNYVERVLDAKADYRKHYAQQLGL